MAGNWSSNWSHRYQNGQALFEINRSDITDGLIQMIQSKIHELNQLTTAEVMPPNQFVLAAFTSTSTSKCLIPAQYTYILIPSLVVKHTPSLTEGSETLLWLTEGPAEPFTASDYPFDIFKLSLFNDRYFVYFAGYSQILIENKGTIQCKI
jgi:hypothetical protein